MPHETSYSDRIFLAALKRRGLDVVALRALTKATQLLGLALGQRLAQMRESGDPPQVAFARIQEHALHARLYLEASQILASRWDRLPERRRPHYTPHARFRILRMKQILALSADETARFFRVSPATILRWEQEAAASPYKQTVGSLLKPVPPVRRYADLVRHLVQTMTLAGFPGAQSVAQTLARAGWKLSKRTVQRIRREPTPSPPPPSRMSHPNRAVRARYPNHVWMMDLTEVPGLFRLFTFKIGVVFDVYSRFPLLARVFLREPSARQLSRMVLTAAARSGAPRHFVSDQGSQFTAERFRGTLLRLRTRQRFGAVGQAGSIALIERFWRTLKALAAFRAIPPLTRRDVERRLRDALRYYATLRPHQGLAGATPAELYHEVQPASVRAAHPPRGRPGETGVTARCSLRIAYRDPERRLPFLIGRVP